jgi:hypothetical protein
MQLLKGVTYSDIMMMPTYERRFFLGLLTKDAKEREEEMEELKNKHGNSKGKRTSRIGGEQLKTRFNNGDIPLI